jgi:hypothetical protein
VEQKKLFTSSAWEEAPNRPDAAPVAAFFSLLFGESCWLKDGKPTTETVTN